MSDDKNNNENEGKLLDHNYDGIQELDNSLPKWWLYSFYACCLFGAIYFYYYEFGGGPSSVEELNTALAKIKTTQVAEVATNTDGGAEVDLDSLVGDETAIIMGQKEYAIKCASCHGKSGEGLIGPNLTDNYWLHGDGKIETIVNTIVVGVPEKGMLAWGPLMSKKSINFVGAYIVSLKGTNPANAKAKEGELRE